MLYWTIGFRVLFLYVLILIVFRLMGRREIGELSILDLVVFLMMGELAVIAIERPEEPLTRALLPIFLLAVLQIIFAFISLKSKKFRELLDGKPEIIINKGKINEAAMKRQRYNFNDLLLQLREKDIRYIDDVEYAILEPSGSLSILQKEKNEKNGTFTLPLVSDGEIDDENLRLIEKNESWLKTELEKRGYPDPKAISFCSYHDGQFYIDEKD